MMLPIPLIRGHEVGPCERLPCPTVRDAGKELCNSPAKARTDAPISRGVPIEGE